MNEDQVSSLLKVLPRQIGIMIHREFQLIERKIMTALDDLKASQATLDTTVVAVLTEIQQFLTDVAGKLGGDDPDLEAVAGDLTSQSQQLQNVLAQLQAADPGQGTGDGTQAPSGDDSGQETPAAS